MKKIFFVVIVIVALFAILETAWVIKDCGGLGHQTEEDYSAAEAKYWKQTLRDKGVEFGSYYNSK